MKRSLLVLTFIIASAAHAQSGKAESTSGPEDRGAQLETGRRNPTAPGMLELERLNQMSPEQRERWLARLPPDRRARIEQRLSRFAQIPPAAQRRLRRDLNRFQQLTPEQQNLARRAFRQLNQLPQNRRDELRRELNHMRGMPAPRREAYVQSDWFKKSYSADEREILEGLARALLRKE